MFHIKASVVHKLCLAAVSGLAMLVSACGVQMEALAPDPQTTPVSTAAQAAAPTTSQPFGINQSDLPQKRQMPVLRKGMTGPAAAELNMVLSELGYLPVRFVPAADEPPVSSAIYHADLASQLEYDIPLSPVGTWQWRAAYPASLQNLWNPAAFNVITQGAMMRFERDHGLATDGIAGPQVDAALAEALRNNQTSSAPYRYVTVVKGTPERIQIWENGRQVFSSLANTGIAQSPTPDGTWPIYLRMTSQTMTGTEPSGKKYRDPGVPWVNYFYKGCAIHGFPRASYGSPQSLGCVELPIDAARQAYPLLDYGTLVTVS